MKRPDRAALTRDYLVDPGPKARRALGEAILADVLRRRSGSPEYCCSIGAEQAGAAVSPQAGERYAAGTQNPDCPCYGIGQDAKGPSEALDSPRRPKEGRGANRELSQRKGRACQGGDKGEKAKPLAELPKDFLDNARRLHKSVNDGDTILADRYIEAKVGIEFHVRIWSRWDDRNTRYFVARIKRSRGGVVSNFDAAVNEA